ncbi:MAG: myo-inosose-2 dehydratase [Oceanospirillaceae bacterium]|nr:myo-inosose-2 dehydratase [Oceanospirillaceae bacterium]
MCVRIGINPLTWTNDDMPALGAETPLEVCLSEGKEAGYAGFELGQKFPRTPEILGPILDNHGLSLVSGWYSSNLLERSVDDEIEALQPHLHLLKTLGATAMVFCEVSRCVHGEMETPVRNRPQMGPTEWPVFLERLEEVAKYLETQGVSMAYHHHMGTVIETEADIDRMMQGAPSVGLLLDSGHLTFAGGDPAAVAKRYANRIKHVHCKDIRKSVMEDAKNRNLSFLQAVLNGAFTVPGDGCIDYPSILAVLKESSYEGWLVVEAEQDPSIAHPLTYAKLGYANLTKLCSDAGISVNQ